MTRPSPPATDYHDRQPLLSVDNLGCVISTPTTSEPRRTHSDPGDTQL